MEPWVYVSKSDVKYSFNKGRGRFTVQHRFGVMPNPEPGGVDATLVENPGKEPGLHGPNRRPGTSCR